MGKGPAGDVQGLLLTLLSGIMPECAQETRIKPRWAARKASALPAVLSLCHAVLRTWGKREVLGVHLGV